MKYLGQCAAMFFACLFNLSLWGQPYFNEWIDHSQNYYKFPVAQEGLHRIEYDALAATNLPLNAAGLQLFRNGQQVPIFVSAADPSGEMQPGDYVEFYAYPNDGAPDSLLYPVREWQPNPRLSLFTDTARYFLTSGNAAESLRFENIANDLSTPPPAEEYFWHKVIRNIRQIHLRGRMISNSGWYYLTHDYGEMEGFASTPLDEVTPEYFFFETPAVYMDAPYGKIKVLMVGLKNEIIILNDHRTQISLNGNHLRRLFI